MGYVASALTKADAGWTGRDLDLSEVVDLDELADLLREGEGDTAVCFVEEDDEYVAIVRVDGDDDARVFVSDRRVLDADGVAGRLLADTALDESVADDAADDADDEAEDDVETESGRPEVEPVGDDALLTDLGVAAPQLLALCAAEGMLPSDVIFALAEALGAGEVLEAVRGI